MAPTIPTPSCNGPHQSHLGDKLPSEPQEEGPNHHKHSHSGIYIFTKAPTPSCLSHVNNNIIHLFVRVHALSQIHTMTGVWQAAVDLLNLYKKQCFVLIAILIVRKEVIVTPDLYLRGGGCTGDFHSFIHLTGGSRGGTRTADVHRFWRAKKQVRFDLFPLYGRVHFYLCYMHSVI